MAEPTVDCLCVGVIVADHVCAPIDHLPAAGELVPTDKLDLTIGGCAANVAVDLAKLGVSVGVVGVVGQDVFGQYVKEALTRCGVDCRHVRVSPTAQTSGTLIINVKGEDRRFIHAVGANAELTGKEVTEQMLRRCRVLYVGGYCLAENLSPEHVSELFRQARAVGVRTVLDVVLPGPSDYWPKLRPVLPFTDVFLPNDDEARLITGENDPVKQAEAFREAGARTVVITCGEKGTVLLSDQNRVRAGVNRVEFVDGTGSGDAFDAGYIFGLLQGEDELQCLRLGSALGASCVRAVGATTGVFTASELEEFLRSHDLPISSLD